MVDLLTLPSYGRYQHTYAEMLAAHDELIAAAGDRMTVLHLGGALDDEITALYLALAGSTTPLGEEGLRDLKAPRRALRDGPQPEAIPVRENRAVVNEARLDAGADLLLDTVTDVLRLACALSGGDVTLQEPTRFRALSRPVRRALLAGLDAVVAANPAKLADVHAHREAFKRLGERLHPHEYPRWPHAADVFAVARGEKEARSFDSRVEELLGAGDVAGAAASAEVRPGQAVPRPGPAAAHGRRPGGAGRCRGRRRAGRRPGLRPGRAVGARALPQPGARRPVEPPRLRQPPGPRLGRPPTTGRPCRRPSATA